MNDRETIRFITGPCPLGELLVAESEQGLCAILMNNSAALLTEELQACFPQAHLLPSEALAEKLAQVVQLIETPSNALSLQLDLRGSTFQKQVWQALQKIPPGQTASYTDLANHLGKPKAARAIAQACAANRLAVAIPCHRVVRRDGELSGYRWGVERKKALLERESSQ